MQRAVHATICFLLVIGPEQLISHTGGQVTASGKLLCFFFLCFFFFLGGGVGGGRLTVPLLPLLTQVFTGNSKKEPQTGPELKLRCLPGAPREHTLVSSWFCFLSIIPGSCLLGEPQQGMHCSEEHGLTV